MSNRGIFYRDPSTPIYRRTIRVSTPSVGPIHHVADRKIITPGNGTSITATWPTNLADGDLVIAIIVARVGGGSGMTITSSAMTEIGESTGGNTTMQVFYHRSDGTETGTFTITLGGSDSYSGFTARVSGAENPATTAPTVTYAYADVDEGQGDPPNHTFTSGDYLIFAAAGKRDDGLLDGAEPSGYRNISSSRTASVPCAMGFGDKRVSNAASENPGTIGWTGIGDWSAVTLAIPGATAIPPTGPIIVFGGFGA